MRFITGRRPDPAILSLDDFEVPKPNLLRRIQLKIASARNNETPLNSGPPLPLSSSPDGSMPHLHLDPDAYVRPVSVGLPANVIEHGINPFSSLQDQASLSQANKALYQLYSSNQTYQKQIAPEKELYALHQRKSFLQDSINSFDNFRPEEHERAPGRLHRLAAFFGKKPGGTLTEDQWEDAIADANSRNLNRDYLERLRLQLAECERSIAALTPKPQVVDMGAPD